MALLFPLAALIERLEAAPSLKLVGTAPDLAAAINTAPRTAPAVFVLAETRGGEIKFSGPPTQQDRTTDAKLVTWVKNHGRARAVREEMDQVLAEIDARMAGWIPAPGFGEAQFTAARDEFAHGAFLVVQAIYRFQWTFSSEVQA